MMTPEERYLHDPEFRMLVDMATKVVLDCRFTPTELKQAVILGAIKAERLSLHREMIYDPNRIG